MYFLKIRCHFPMMIDHNYTSRSKHEYADGRAAESEWLTAYVNRPMDFALFAVVTKAC